VAGGGLENLVPWQHHGAGKTVKCSGGWSTCVFGILILLAATPVATARSRADAVAGTWGAVQANGAPKCGGTTVLVFHEGRYFRVLPNVGSTGGNNQLILSRSTYELSGDRLTVAPALSFTNPEPRRRFLVQRIGERSLILQGKERVTFRPCPPIDPESLDSVVK